MGSRLVERVLVIGAAGMIGRKLTERLAKDGGLNGSKIGELVLHDVVAAPAPTFKARSIISDLSSPGEAEKLVAGRPGVIFHLAAIVSGEAEAEFEKGYRTNLDGTRALFEAIRKMGGGYKPRVVFTSSIAVFGAPFPEAIGDEFLNEPLAGQEAVLPVPKSVRHWFASPRAAIGFLLHAADLETAQLGARRSLTMPGVSATVGEQIEALRRVAGEAAVRRIREEPDATIMRIVEGWPRNFDATRATALGFRADASFDDIIRIHMEDELGQRTPVPRQGRA